MDQSLYGCDLHAKGRWLFDSAQQLEGVEMIAVDNFKAILMHRMKGLADATIRPCGLEPVAWHAEQEIETIQLLAIAELASATGRLITLSIKDEACIYVRPLYFRKNHEGVF
ncbi:hypothetical protein GC096_32980 [Paenibacillus sp. LMG 31461]|uniref:Uncharacterized protein n=1 Tax=Paenibacillus plantarum TaxID=2654975 RepID=A0ABX1XJW4_9BACL|nr:hypothetical protein [Paenibacillus plantarum]NOU68835.1 hypothetical protein [Paenibacillus plantarum]